MKKLYFVMLLTSIMSNVPASNNGSSVPTDNSSQSGNRIYKGQHFSWEKELVGQLSEQINYKWVKLSSYHITSEIIKQKLSDEGIVLDSTDEKRLFKRLNDRVRWNVDLENKAQLQQNHKKYAYKKAKFDNNPDLAWTYTASDDNSEKNILGVLRLNNSDCDEEAAKKARIAAYQKDYQRKRYQDPEVKAHKAENQREYRKRKAAAALVAAQLNNNENMIS